MVKHSYSTEIDQHDPKEFRESFGSFGTTTRPGANQLQELQAKVRQGVKHVELHLASKGKGQFGQQDVPDKYGFEQRRTIMQLAKLNNQSLSVHASFDVVSFSGLGQQGFNEAERSVNIREIDESIRFAAQTAKQGAVVFHIQGDPLSTSRSELNLSKRYIEWLKQNKPGEFSRLQKEYFDKNPLHRRFVDNIDQEFEVKEEFEKLKTQNPQKYQQFVQEAQNSHENKEPWEYYYLHRTVEKNKVAPDVNPLIVVGDQISQVDRKQEFIDLEYFKNNSSKKLNDNEKKILEKAGIPTNDDLSVDTYFKASSLFTNGIPKELQGVVSEKDFTTLKQKLLVTYDSVLEDNYNLQGQADKEFYEKLNRTQIELASLQKKRLEKKYEMYKNELAQIKELDQQRNQLVDKVEKDTTVNEKIKEDIDKTNARRQQLIYTMGINEYEELARYDETISQINKQIHDIEGQIGNVRAITDETFDKNAQAMGDLGLKAMRYQLDMKKKAKIGEKKVEEITAEAQSLQKQYLNEKDPLQREKLKDAYNKKRYELKEWTGTKDYADIDVVKQPLYLAPENMLPGYGSLTNLEEYKGIIRMSQEEFAQKLISEDKESKQLREEYEKETGVKITSLDDAREIAKRHIGGTFDNAHAGVWLKHFRRENGESEQERVKRFNEWLNSQAEDMYKDKIIRHVHFNDTQAKDDDHNLLGQGVLDIHDLKERLRQAGFKESFIVEAGGRGADSIMHLHNAWDIFNPSLFADSNSLGGSENGYRVPTEQLTGAGVSDWVSVKREYEQRPQYSQYGFGYSAFKHNPPQKGSKGSWSGTGFL